jgi:hypothetical protein
MGSKLMRFLPTGFLSIEVEVPELLALTQARAAGGIISEARMPNEK